MIPSDVIKALISQRYFILEMGHRNLTPDQKHNLLNIYNQNQAVVSLLNLQDVVPGMDTLLQEQNEIVELKALYAKEAKCSS